MNMKKKTLVLFLLTAALVMALSVIFAYNFALIFKEAENSKYNFKVEVTKPGPHGCWEHMTVYPTENNDLEDPECTRIEICKTLDGSFYNLVIKHPKGNLPRECLRPETGFYDRLYEDPNTIFIESATP